MSVLPHEKTSHNNAAMDKNQVNDELEGCCCDKLIVRKEKSKLHLLSFMEQEKR